MRETTNAILEKLVGSLSAGNGKMLLYDERQPRAAEAIPAVAANQQRVVTITFVTTK